MMTTIPIPTAEIDDFLRRYLKVCGLKYCAHRIGWEEPETARYAVDLGVIEYIGRRGNWYPHHDALCAAAIKKIVMLTGFSAKAVIKHLAELNKDDGLEVPDLPVPTYKEEG